MRCDSGGGNALVADGPDQHNNLSKLEPRTVPRVTRFLNRMRFKKPEPELELDKGTMAPRLEPSEGLMAGTGRGNVLQTAAIAHVLQTCARHSCHSSIIEQVGTKNGAISHQVFESHAIQKPGD